MHLSTTPSTVYSCSASGRREQQEPFSPSSETLREGGPAFSHEVLLLMTREANTKKRDPGGVISFS